MADPALDRPGRPFVGFYWTLPLPTVGFTRLPEDIEGAARASKTIRYQRERVRDWVKEQGGHVAAEFAFMELYPDRGSPEIAGPFQKAVATATNLGAELVYVEFWSRHNARLHHRLLDLLNQHHDLCMPLPPDPIRGVDGIDFDPVDHFRRRRQTVPRAWSDEHRAETLAAVAHEVMASGSARGSAGRIAAGLNARSITTLNGRAWTAANVRAFLSKQFE